MAFQGIPLGRAGSVSIAPTSNDAIRILGLKEFLRDLAKQDDRFNTKMREASRGVAEMILDGARMEAATTTRNRQALEVMKGMRTYNDRIPTVKLSDRSGFVSQSRPNRKRKRKVTRGDVFFGAEFGGGKFGANNRTTAYQESRARRTGAEGALIRSGRRGRGTTTQFLPHRGRKGYFFWPAVRRLRGQIATAYLSAIDKVLRDLAD